MIFELVCIVFGIVFAPAEGFKTGAPDRACYNGMPCHAYGSAGCYGPYFGQHSSALPHHAVRDIFDTKAYDLEAEAKGDKVQLKLVGVDGKQFKGFLVLITAPYSRVPVGSFQYLSDGQLKNCKGLQDAITHTDNNLKSSVQAEWIPPNHGRFIARVTIVEDFYTAHYLTREISVSASPKSLYY